jgi:conjugative transposon TraK protein
VQVNNANQRVIIIAGGKAFQALVGNRKDNIAVEARDHIKVFHEDFFNLSPDEKAIQAGIRKALYLADGSAKDQYDQLEEKGFYSSLISGNVSQEVSCDSITINLQADPVYFRYYGKQKITRPSVLITRSLITEGYIRDLNERTDNNPHGFLIERWVTLEKKDLNVKKR